MDGILSVEALWRPVEGLLSLEGMWNILCLQKTYLRKTSERSFLYKRSVGGIHFTCGHWMISNLCKVFYIQEIYGMYFTYMSSMDNLLSAKDL